MIATLAASLGLSPDDPSFWMPLVFVGLLLLLMAAGIVLDGFDIGVGLLLQLAPSEERGRMMGLLSPWRDANEFWPLLGLGLFVSAFPFAWGVVLGKLFGPLTVMALGMVLRSVSFEFRIRARTEIKPRWIFGFWVGSLLTALGQGMVLGRIATDYQADAGYGWFAFFVGLCAMAAYALLGACWLVMRVDGFSWLPFVLCVMLFVLMLCGLAYSFFPYLILDDMTIWDGSGALDSMRLVLAGTVIGVPVVLVFNILAYRSVFGKERRPVPLLPPPGA
ncbi:cytochrome d ubiquinol oxidase subunit II [Bordetella bronchiseptica]